MGPLLAINTAALKLQHRIEAASKQVADSLECLATGKRVNRASDDPTAIQSLSPMKARIASINAEIKAIDERGFYHSAREGALSVVSDSLLELGSLVTTAANKDALSEDEFDSLRLEAVSIMQGIDFLANTATFRGQQILTGYSASGLGLDGLFKQERPTDEELQAADEAVKRAIDSVAGSRAAIGRAQKEDDSRRDSLLSELENLTGAVSSIEDTDYAKETAALVRAQLLRQVSTYLATINADTQRDTILKLISASTTTASTGP
ncbi:MAG: flagellin [Phycisphaerales bacterium]